MDRPVKARLFWFKDDPTPADRVCKSESEAATYAAERSSEVQGRVELFSGPNIPAFATYEGGIRITFNPELSPSFLAGDVEELAQLQ